MVDLWAPLKNYKDTNFAELEEQERRMQRARGHVSQWKGKAHLIRNDTVAAAAMFEDEYVRDEGSAGQALVVLWAPSGEKRPCSVPCKAPCFLFP